ncbi:hypothetical protein CEXT_26961 [Caerostris extrusa]|uniref:Uncharacterized protein n=1 Tax=Caerostris extrusa TaxID=172846 RepID=A0AAV4MIW7_CAEEX|nr:hypothetical protein CEXT_26961 [Caerostris extrusa]
MIWRFPPREWTFSGPPDSALAASRGCHENDNVKDNEKVSPEEMCRQISTAMKEMDVIDTIVEQSKRSDLPQDYIQMNENLLQKRQYLVEWVSRFH